MIRFSCQCGRMLQAREDMIGQKALCPLCHSEQVVPATDEGAYQQVLPAAEPARPDPPRRSRDEDWDDRPRRKRPPVPVADTSYKAVIAMVLGFLSLVGLLLAGIPAMILGFLALRDVKKSEGKLLGRGIALTGLLVGALGTFLITPLCGVFVVYPVYERIREEHGFEETGNKLHQIGVAMHAYHDAHGRFPPAALRGGPGNKPLLSWRVALLPYLGENALHSRFRLHEPWDSPTNKALLAQMPDVYAFPHDNPANAQGKTFYQVFVGPGTVFENGEGVAMHQITDGTSNTVLVAEAAKAVEWTRPDDLAFDPRPFVPLPGLGGQFRNGFTVLMADGSARWIDKNTDDQTRRWMIQRNDGMPFWLPQPNIP